jgi:hypothetical protein
MLTGARQLNLDSQGAAAPVRFAEDCRRLLQSARNNNSMTVREILAAMGFEFQPQGRSYEPAAASGTSRIRRKLRQRLLHF